MQSQSFLQVVSFAATNGIHGCLVPPKTNEPPKAPVLKAPRSAPLITSPTKRFRSVDKSKRATKKYKSSQSLQLGVEIAR